MKKDEIVVNIGMIAFFLFMLIQATELRFVRRFAEMGSGFWPILTLSFATLLSVVLLISNLRKYIQEKESHAGKRVISPEAKIALRSQRRKVALSVVCLLGYVVVMPYIGFILSTFLYVLAFILALGERRKLVLTLSPILVTVIAVIVFAKLIAMPLPKGIDIFATFSRLIY